MDPQTIFYAALIGIMGGLLSGLLGVGGGVVIIPALIFLVGLSQQEAQGTTLAMMVLPIGLLAAYQYHLKGFVNLKLALIMAVFFFVSGYFGAKYATQVPADILRKIFALMLVIVAIRMWLK